MKYKSGQIIKGVCVDLSYEGKGVLKGDGKVVFVPGLFPGEEAEVELSYSKNGASFGKIKRILQISKDRIQPLCPVCSSCGGCCFQQYDYKAELLYKQNKVKEQFRKIAGMNVEVLPTEPMEDNTYYRNKIQIPFGKDKNGNIVYGFFKEGTHQIVPIEECFIEDKRSQHILSSIRDLMNAFKIEPYDEDSRRGILRHALIRTSRHEDEIMLVLVTSVDSFPGRNNFVKALTKACPEITTIIQNINKRHTNVILGEQERVLFGKGYIVDSLCGVSFKVSSKSFFQTNPVMTEKLYKFAIDSAKISKNDIVFDAYSGVGTIGLIASRYCKQVISVELVKEAVLDGRKNAKENNIENFEMVCADAAKYAKSLASSKVKVDVLIMDPPRKGSDEVFLNSVLELKPKKIVYVSCDPSTLARDVLILSKQYEVALIKPFDMFPRVHHVETVGCLRLKER